jgi:hypothetical protein
MGVEGFEGESIGYQQMLKKVLKTDTWACSGNWGYMPNGKPLILVRIFNRM